MTLPVIVCRPEPGATATARRAQALGLRAIIAPLFTVAPLAWDPPDAARFDAVMMTSANAARHGGPALEHFRHLPLFAVGDATAACAKEAGFGEVIAGGSNVGVLARLIADAPHRRILHLCGRDVRPAAAQVSGHVRIPVYASLAAHTLPSAVGEAGPAVVLLHSPRAAATFRKLVGSSCIPLDRLIGVAISAAAAVAAGGGWRGIHAAPEPTDRAMLAIAQILCDKDRQ